MRRWLALSLLVALAPGCSILFSTDYDAGPRDAGMDGGPIDGGPIDGGPADAGPDAGPFDAGCVQRQTFESSCADGVDNDCDGLVDCAADPDCASAGACCNVIERAGARWGTTTTLSAGTWLPFGNEPNLMGTSVQFDDGAVGSVVHPVCVPLGYGARIVTNLVVGGSDASTFASLVLSPTAGVDGDGRVLADLAVRIVGRPGGLFEARVERAGATLGETFMVGTGQHEVIVGLAPSFDEGGRAVMEATVTVGEDELIDDFPFMPLEDLRGPAGGCDAGVDGLFIALEGRTRLASVVEVDGDGVKVDLFECANPNQFTPERTLPPLVGQLGDPAWRAGGVGEPSIAHFRTGPDGMDDRFEIWVDASTEERSDEIFRPIDFSLGAAFRTASWQVRTAGGSEVLHAAREPSFAVPVDGSDIFEDGQMYLAFVVEGSTGPVIRYGSVAAGATAPVRDDGEIALTGCDGYRDPALVPLGPRPTGIGDGFLLFFTCERSGVEPDRIGVARISAVSTGAWTVLAQTTDALIPSESYSEGGVYSPEVAAHVVDGNVDLRVWYLARGRSREESRVAFSFGRMPLAPADGLPTLAPYPGNPVLGPRDPVLGNEECELGCDIESFSVTRAQTVAPWETGGPYHLFVVARTRYDTGGIEHELIPLLQVRQ